MPAMLAEAAQSGPPWWVAILLGVLALAGTLGAAYLSRPKPAAEAPPRTDRALDLIEATMHDLRAERDEAQDEARQLRARVDELETRLRGGDDDQ